MSPTTTTQHQEATTMTATKPTTTNDLITVKKALRELDIQPSTFYVACKRHDWLRNAITEQFNEDIERNVKYITRAAVERYAAERRPGHSANGHEGFKHAIYLTDDEVAQAVKVLSETLGREVTIERMYKTKGKAESNGVEAETETEEQDDTEE
jgi:hypothetical protein